MRGASESQVAKKEKATMCQKKNDLPMIFFPMSFFFFFYSRNIFFHCDLGPSYKVRKWS